MYDYEAPEEYERVDEDAAEPYDPNGSPAEPWQPLPVDPEDMEC